MAFLIGITAVAKLAILFIPRAFFRETMDLGEAGIILELVAWLGILAVL
jgi:hypothetical protein